MTEKKGKISVSYSKLIVEVISVIFAILLALTIDSCKTEKANNDLAEIGLKRIKTEISNNFKRVKGLNKLHKKLFGTLKTTLDKMEKDDFSDIKEISINFTITFLSKTAWKTAMVTQALRYMDFSLVQKISTVYDIQDFYSSQVEDLVNIIKEISINKDLEEKKFRTKFRTVVSNLEVVVMLETNLISIYKKILESKDFN